jgi:hypothetical protein
MDNYPWQGAGKALIDYELGKIGSKIGVSEDVVRMIVDVESRGKGFDSNGVIRLFEEHKFYKHVNLKKRTTAVNAGVAYPRWRSNYKNNYNHFLIAYKLDPTAALLSCSWGLGQIMGENCKLVGYATPLAMVKAFAESEANQLKAMIDFIVTTKIDDELREMDKTTDKVKLFSLARIVAKTYNGSGYEKNAYHTRLVNRLLYWRSKKDAVWSVEEPVKENSATVEVSIKTAETFDKALSQESPPGKKVVNWFFLAIRALFAKRS